MYTNRLRQLSQDEPLFYLPPYEFEQTFITLTEPIDWAKRMLNLPNFWRHSEGKGVTVAVLDTGIASQHSDLKAAIVGSEDFTNSPYGPADMVGHGTHCAGIIAARRNNSGLVGVAPACNLLVAKVLDDDGNGSANSIVEGIRWAVSCGADILSMSFGSNAHFPKIQKAIKEAIDQNVMVICAAGNDGPQEQSVDFPANYKPVIAVGAIDRRWKVRPFSARGPEVDFVAPGYKITSTYPPNNYMRMNGTSMAAPFIAGIAALIVSKHRQYGGQTPVTNQEELMAHLKATALDLGILGHDELYGYGLPRFPEESDVATMID